MTKTLIKPLLFFLFIACNPKEKKAIEPAQVNSEPNEEALVPDTAAAAAVVIPFIDLADSSDWPTGVIEAQRLELDGSISYLPNEKQLKIGDSLRSGNYFVTDKYKKGGLHFFKRKGKSWEVYNIPDVGPNTRLSSASRLSNGFVEVDVIRSYSGYISGVYGMAVIIDPKNLIFYQFTNKYSEDDYSPKPEDSKWTPGQWTSKVEIANGVLSVTKSDTMENINSELYYGKYRIEKDRLIQTKVFIEKDSLWVSFYTANGFYTGMDTFSFQRRFHGAEFKIKPVYEYGVDDDSPGIEVSRNGVIQLFAFVHGDQVIDWAYISPDFSCEGINTGIPVQDLLKKFPSARLNIDLIDDTEYLSCREFRGKIVFRTTNKNRIGIYGKDWEDGTRKVRRNAKPDYIQIF